MTPEQLAAARASHWHQDAQPLMTLDDASTWLERMQLALYLPRKAHVLAPAPSFVEAVAGTGSATPGPEAIEQANALLVRLVQEGTVVPLNLFGTPGEQPDFLIATHALSHIAALQGDRNWKKPPSGTGPGKVSPMAVEVWKLLDREGALTANEIREQLGHELTEAATIRGLSELWQNLRVAPLPSEDGEGANWQILAVTHKKEMAAGSTMSQSAALSMLVANYLQSVVTGTAEDIEAFLSPVASRSRLRDVVRGLTATRQLRTLSMDAQTFLFIEGTLPEVPEVASADSAEAEAKPSFMGRSAYRERMLNKGKEEEEPAQDASADRPRRSFSDRTSPARPPAQSDAPRRFAAGSGSSSTFRKRPEGGSDRASGPRRSFGSGGAGPSRSGSDRPSFSDRSTARPPRSSDRPGFSRPGAPAERGDRPSRPFTPRSGGDRPAPGRSFGAGRPSSGDRPAFGRKPGGSRPFSKPGGASRSGPGEGRPFAPRPFTPRTEGGGDGARAGFKPRSSFSKDRAPGSERPFRPREGSDRAAARPGYDARPRSSEGRFPPRDGSRPPTDEKNSSRAGFMSRAGGRSGRPTGDRPRPDRAAGDRPSSGRPRPPRADGDRPYSPRPRPGGGEGRPSEGRSTEGRPPRRFDAKPSYPRRDAGSGGDSRPPRREGSSSGYPSNPNRPSRAPRPAGSFTKRDGAPGRPSSGRPSSGRPAGGPSSGGRPPSRGGRPGFSSRPDSGRPSGRPPGSPAGPGSRPSSAASPGRNPGGTGRPGGPRAGGSRYGGPRAGGSSGRPSSGGRPGTGRPGTGRSGGGKPGGAPRPGGMKPPSRKPRPAKDSE